MSENRCTCGQRDVQIDGALLEKAAQVAVATEGTRSGRNARDIYMALNEMRLAALRSLVGDGQ